MKISNLLAGVAFALVLATAVVRLALAGVIADLLVGIMVWAVATLSVGVGLMASTWWLTVRWSRQDRAVTLPFAADAGGSQVYAGKRAA